MPTEVNVVMEVEVEDGQPGRFVVGKGPFGYVVIDSKEKKAVGASIDYHEFAAKAAAEKNLWDLANRLAATPAMPHLLKGLAGLVDEARELILFHGKTA